MDRRAFIGRLAWRIGVGFLAAPLGAAAQTPRAFRLAFLANLTEAAMASREEALRAGLRDLDYVEGQTIVVVSWYAGGKFEQFPALVKELIATSPDVIVTRTAVSCPMVRTSWTCIAGRRCAWTRS